MHVASEIVGELDPPPALIHVGMMEDSITYFKQLPDGASNTALRPFDKIPETQVQGRAQSARDFVGVASNECTTKAVWAVQCLARSVSVRSSNLPTDLFRTTSVNPVELLRSLGTAARPIARPARVTWRCQLLRVVTRTIAEVRFIVVRNRSVHTSSFCLNETQNSVH